MGPRHIEGNYQITNMHSFELYAEYDAQLVFGGWGTNHGTPWGEGPVITYWPRQKNDRGEWVYMHPDERDTMIENGRLRSVRRGRTNMDFFSFQSAHDSWANDSPGTFRAAAPE